MLFPKEPVFYPPRIIYKGYVQEGEGQYPIAKTRDWVEEDFASMDERLKWAAWTGFKYSSFFALADIFAVRGITDRRAQLARFTYFTVPLTGIAAGWMGGVEFAKIILGRDNELAWAAGAVLPGGIMGIWSRNIAGGVRTAGVLGLIGMAYQWSTNNNLTNSILKGKDSDNPNRPGTYYEKKVSFFWPSRADRPEDSMHHKIFWEKDPGPSWKKFEEKSEE